MPISKKKRLDRFQRVQHVYQVPGFASMQGKVEMRLDPKGDAKVLLQDKGIDFGIFFRFS